MNARGLMGVFIAAMVMAGACFAAEEFRIPGEQAKAVVGTWRVTSMNDGEQEEKTPPESNWLLTFREDGSAAMSEGKDSGESFRWGANEKGAIALQLKKENGAGDAVTGTWEKIGEGIKLSMREYENGQIPEDDVVVLTLRSVSKSADAASEKKNGLLNQGRSMP